MKRGKNESIYVPTPEGGLVQRSCGTSIPKVVAGMKRMVADCRDRPEWHPILSAIEAKKLTLREAYRHYHHRTLDQLVARLSAVNLVEHLDGWYAWCVANRQDGVRTPDVYWQQVTSLVAPGLELPTSTKRRTPKPFPASELTKAKVIAWLTGRAKASSGTRRKYLYALRSFTRYLLDVGAMGTDPTAGMKAPKKNRKRERWESAAVDETIVANSLPRYQAFFAFIHGTGCDVGSAERAQLGDVNVFAGTTKVRGTKTDRRAVHDADIEPWALPYIRSHIKAMQGKDRSTLLFTGLPRRSFQQYHDKLCTRLGITDYTLKDARHSVAVRMRKAGRTFEEIAQQLGTSVFQTVNVYAAYRPDTPAHEEASHG